MSSSRDILQKALCSYITDTFGYIDTVKGFCERFSSWKDTREAEVTKLNNKIEQQQLDAVLEDTLGGLEELHSFLDAVEKLAVTSLHVFTEENQVLHLPEGISPEQVQVVIVAARLICPLLLEFKRDPKVFFLPKLQNVEVLAYQLDKYIRTIEKICDKFEKCSINDVSLNINRDIVDRETRDLSGNFPEENIQNMLCHINQLHEIRMDQDFRMVFLFQEDSCSDFINKFNECRPRMLQFLSELEECAVQLDKMNKGAKISNVAGSSLGAIGGVLSIVGLALSPVTAGVSLGLTVGGTALGITSGVNSLVTTATEAGVNHTQQKKADEIFENFMGNVQSLQDCLEEVTSQTVTRIEAKPLDVFLGAGNVAFEVPGIEKGVQSFANDVAASKALKGQDMMTSTCKMVAKEGAVFGKATRMAAEIPDIGQAAVKGSLSVSKSARAGLFALNGLFLGMDIFFICKDSVSLAKGSETKVSQFIRARSALWSSEIDSWQKIHDSLSKGLQTSEKQQAVLVKQFYPEMEEKKQTEMEEQRAVLETPLNSEVKKQGKLPLKTRIKKRKTCFCVVM